MRAALTAMMGFCVMLASPYGAHAQHDTASRRADSVARLEAVVVTVTRGSQRSVLSSPFAISVVTPDSSRPGQRHTAIDESLALVPGLSAVSRNNPSQDPRISIRGFGARSAFGVRGVRVLRDGMPLTLPDGQTPLDYLSLESVGRVEVMRGAASALYGNASGGVVDIRSVTPSRPGFAAAARQWFASDRFSRSVIVAQGMQGRSSFVGDAAFSRSDGSRDHSRHRATSAFARTGLETASSRYALTVLALNNPLAENPGALTREEVGADREAADPSAVRRDARKAVRQFQVGASATRRQPWGEMELSAFGGARALDNPLTFAVVEIGRRSHGTGVALRRDLLIAGLRHRLNAGVDVQWQNDLRRNYATCADTVPQLPSASCPDPRNERGVVTLDQRELVTSAGTYASAELALGETFVGSLGVRADNIQFEVRDRLVSANNSDDSGRRSLRAVSPIAGILARLSRAHSAYANFSTAFETPTATELGNHADGSAGFNPDLNPQRSATLEVGAKGFGSRGVSYDVAVFDTRARDELIAFEIPGSDGRRFFRNAGRTRRRGAEAGINASAGTMSFVLAYSYSHFRFKEYRTTAADLAGKVIPGNPGHRLQTAVTLKPSAGFVTIETEAAGNAFLDDANSVRASGYEVAHIRAGFTLLRGTPSVGFSAGVQNMFDRRYSASLAVNAARGRYFEPASGRTVHVGVSLSHAPSPPP